MSTEPSRARVRPPALGDIRAGRPRVLGGSVTTLLRRTASIVALIVLDFSGLVLGLYAALVLRALLYGEDVLWGAIWRVESDWLPFLALVMVLVFWRAGLYAKRERRSGGGRIVGSLILVGLVALAFGIGTNRQFGTYGLAPTAVVSCIAFIGLLRASYDVVTADLFRIAGVRRRAVLVGDRESVEHLKRVLGQGRGGIAYDFVGGVGPSGDGMSLPYLGSIADLPHIFAERQPDELIVAESEFDDQGLLELVDLAHRRGVRVRAAPTTAELLTQRAEYVPGQGVPLFELRPPAVVGTDWALKRTFDLAVSVLVVVIGLPLWLAIAAAIKLDSRGPVFFRDRRVGLDEREFEMIKFRTMYEDAPARQARLEAANEAGGALFKLRDDPRVTRVGRFLRRFSLDEAPQVLNVLRREMSLVGPRPLVVDDDAGIERLDRGRLRLTPGMTGHWQILGAARIPTHEMVAIDYLYVANWSLWTDLKILLRTVSYMLARRGV